MAHPGIIALDIDGTITEQPEGLPPGIKEFLNSLIEKGWQLAFITGRPFAQALRAVRTLPFPFILSAQNGSVIVQMPSNSLIAKNYLSRSLLPQIDQIFDPLPIDYVIFAGIEHDDRCYYRDPKTTPQALALLNRRKEISLENWIPLETFDALPCDNFPVIKCLGDRDSVLTGSNRVAEQLGLFMPVILDPLSDGIFLGQGSSAEATKGKALEQIAQYLDSKGPIIAAGDDHNDVQMLQVADCGIAMTGSPEELLRVADIVAPPCGELGIICGLEEAMQKV